MKYEWEQGVRARVRVGSERKIKGKSRIRE